MNEELLGSETPQIACFGRMTLELPRNTRPQGSLYRYPGAYKELMLNTKISKDAHLNELRKFEEYLQSSKHEKGGSLLKSTHTVPGNSDAKVFVHWENDYSELIMTITGFARLPNDVQYRFSSEVSLPFIEAATEKAINSLSRLRARSETDVPSENGFCLDLAFLPDQLKGAELERAEISFKVESWQETYISVQTFVNQVKEPASLLQRLARARSQPGFSSNYSVIRSGQRTVGEFQGEEVLALVTEKYRRYFHFIWEVEGELHRNDPPDIKLELHVGQDGKPGEMTKAQALALWEYLLPRLKLRPVTAKPTTVSDACKRVPIGERHVTGRTCPQTGWWECDDPLPLAQPAGLWLEEGQRFPMARVWRQPSLWQQLQGVHPVGTTAALWRLAAYEAPPGTASQQQASQGGGRS